MFPPQPDGVMTLGQMRRPWQADVGADRYRRGLYTYFWRATPYPFLTVFDAPGGVQTCTRRFRSNTPLQALTLLNDPAFVEIAQGWQSESSANAPGPASDRERLQYALASLPGPFAVRPRADDARGAARERAQAIAPAPRRARRAVGDRGSRALEPR